MGTLIKYRIKCFLKNKTLLFWTLLFPCALATIFNFVLKDISTLESIETIDVAVVKGENTSMLNLVEELSNKDGENYILDVFYVNEKEAKQLLEDSKVSAILYLNETPNLEAVSYGYDLTILKSVINSYSRVYSQVGHLMESDPALFQKLAIEDLFKSNLEIKTKQSEGSEKDVSMVYFYNAVAMCCLYGMLWGVRICSDSQATQSKQAARVNVSPLPKIKMLSIDFLIGLTFIVVESALSILYMHFILSINFTNQIGLLSLVILMSSFMSLSLGILIGTVKSFNLETKIGLISGITVFLNFLAGMMANTMPYMIDTYAPIIRYINPADLIVRSFSMMYYYTDMTPVYVNIAILSAMGCVFLLVSYIRVRRVSYASL